MHGNYDSGESEAVILIKAAPQVSSKHGETVCCAGLDIYGNWLRLYPVSFRTLDEEQKFGRWDHVRFCWRRPKDDPRTESRRVEQMTLMIAGQLRKAERQKFLDRAIVTSLNAERAAGKSLALLRAEILEFRVERKAASEVAKESRRCADLRAQGDLFDARRIVPYEPCPYRFKYRYRSDDGEREGTCQDWEIEATYFRWAKGGEQQALNGLRCVFGEEYPNKGMLLAMGTHSLYPDTWLINGVIRLDDIRQHSLF